MSFEQMMSRIPVCKQRAHMLLKILQENKSSLFSVPENTTHYAFRVSFTNHHFCMSISCPPDVSYACYETALCNSQGNLFYNESLGYQDVCRFDTVQELFKEILRIGEIRLPSS